MISRKEFSKYGKNIGYGLLISLVIFIVFTIFINKQDLTQLNIKNSNRRKIEDKYSDTNINKSKENMFLYKQTNKLKNYKKSLQKNNKILDFSGFQKNIKDYKKKLKDNKKNKLNK